MAATALTSLAKAGGPCQTPCFPSANRHRSMSRWNDLPQCFWTWLSLGARHCLAGWKNLYRLGRIRKRPLPQWSCSSMIRLFRLLTPFRTPIVVVFVLVFLQCLANLYLPTLMADIVDKAI